MAAKKKVVTKKKVKKKINVKRKTETPLLILSDFK